MDCSYTDKLITEEGFLPFHEFILEAGIDLDREKIFEHYCKIFSISSVVDNIEYKKIGLSLNVFDLEHSCNPNAYLIHKGSKDGILFFKNILPDGKITINYLGEIYP